MLDNNGLFFLVILILRKNIFAFISVFLIQLNCVVSDTAVHRCDASCLGGGEVQSASSTRFENSAQTVQCSLNRTVLFIICFVFFIICVCCFFWFVFFPTVRSEEE